MGICEQERSTRFRLIDYDILKRITGHSLDKTYDYDNDVSLTLNGGGHIAMPVS